MRHETGYEPVRVGEVELQRARVLGLLDLGTPIVVHTESPIARVDVLVARQRRAHQSSGYETAMPVFLESKSIPLGELFVREQLFVAVNELRVGNALRLGEPEMDFPVTELRTSPRRR